MKAVGRTRSVAAVDSSVVGDDWLAVVADSGVDDRSVLPFWRARQARLATRTLLVRTQGREHIDCELGAEPVTIDLRSKQSGRQLFTRWGTACIDISGLAHHVWAPLVASALEACSDVRVVYAEPYEYRKHASPASHTLFDLTERFDGVEPLPGFARLRGPGRSQQSIFVPLLGFEGSRARHLASALDPLPLTIPVIGVPGFRIELPTFTLVCNRDFIAETRSGGRLRFARASCPFEALQVLEDIGRDNPGAYLHIAPVGTKPHALGAVLFAIENPRSSELIYDHPVRRVKRSSGVGQIHIYSLNRA